MIAILLKLSACNFILFLSAEYDPVADEAVQDDEELQVFWLHARPVISTGKSEFFLLFRPSKIFRLITDIVQ
jgi:hypothetical protein